jgi:hypothetical protein
MGDDDIYHAYIFWVTGSFYLPRLKYNTPIYFEKLSSAGKKIDTNNEGLFNT